MINEIISVDPKINLKRKAQVIEFNWNPKLEQIALVTEVTFYENDGTTKIVADRLKPYVVKLLAVNSTLVNPANGATVEDGELEANCTLGEYDFLVGVANTNTNIFNIMKATIATADTRGRFNK